MDKRNILYLNFEDDRLFGFGLADCQKILDVFYGDRPDKWHPSKALNSFEGWHRESNPQK